MAVLIVKIFTGRGAAGENVPEKLVFSGKLAHVPRVGEFVEVSPEYHGLPVQRVIHAVHWREVWVYLPPDYRDHLTPIV